MFKILFFTMLTLLSYQRADAAAVIFSGQNVKSLKQHLDLNGVAMVLTGSADPTSVAPQSCPQGSIYLRTGASGGSIYTHSDSGATTNWTIGSGNQVYALSGVPSAGTGASGDFYIDISSGNFYKKSGGSWGSILGNLAGPFTIALADAATIAVDASLGNNFTVTLGGNRTLGAPTNPTAGQVITIRIRQDGTGARTLAYNAIYRFGDDVPTPTLSTAAAKNDYLKFIYNATDTRWDAISVARGY